MPSTGRKLVFDDAGGIVERDSGNDRHSLVPITKFAWLTPVQFLQTLDRVGEGAAVVVFRVLHGGRRSQAVLYDATSAVVVLPTG